VRWERVDRGLDARKRRHRSPVGQVDEGDQLVEETILRAVVDEPRSGICGGDRLGIDLDGAAGNDDPRFGIRAPGAAHGLA
jgi:hypothetical protein